MFTAVELFPINLFVANIGFIGWLCVGMLWHDRALILLNGIATFIFALGILKFYMGVSL